MQRWRDGETVNSQTDERAWNVVKHYHEMFASGFETFLMEGKAPTPELRNLFATFRDWLLLVYKRLLKSTPLKANRYEGVELNDEVRGFFDRLVATDAEIEAAKAEHKLEGNSLKILGMTGEQAKKHEQLINEANDEAQADLTASAMDEARRETTKWWKAGVKEHEADVTEELNATNTYRARDYLSGDRDIEGLPEGLKLDRDYVVEHYGKAAARKLTKMIAKDGAHPELVSNWFEYAGADEMVTDLLGSMNKAERKKYARAEAESRMKQVHGDMMTDGTIDQKARSSLHNNKQAERLHAEAAFLNEQAGKKTPPRSRYKAAAEQQVAQTAIKDIRPDVHRRQEVRARNEALKAAAKGDLVKAAMEQHRALRQFYLYRESVKALEQADKDAKVGKSMKGKKLNKIRQAGDHYYDQITALLEKFEFRTLSNKQLEKRQAMRAWLDKTMNQAGEGDPKRNHEVLSEAEKQAEYDASVDDEQKAGPDTNTMDRLIEQAGRTNWRELTPGELSAVASALKSVEHLARLKNKLLTAKDKRDLNEWVTELLDSIEKNSTSKKVKDFGSTTTWWEDRKKGFEAFRDISKTPTGILKMLDGFEQDGVAWNLIGRPLQEAAAAETEQVNQANKDLEKIFDRYTAKEMGLFNRKVFDERLQRNITKHDAISVLLNWGNATNRARVMDGFGIDEDTANYIMDTYLTEKDYEFVKDVWAYLDTFKKASFDLHKDLFGFTPDEVEAEPFPTKYGVMPGGYYPIKYDALKSSAAEQHQMTKLGESFTQGIQSKKVLGSTQARVARVYRPLQTDMTGVIFSHVSDVIHQTTHDRALYDIGRVLSNDQVKQAISDSYGDHIYQQLTSMVRNIKDGTEQVKDIQDRIAQTVRNNATLAMLGASFRTIVLQPFGLTNSIAKARMSGIGVKGLLDGYANHFSEMVKSNAIIREESSYMRNREETQSVAISRIKNKIRKTSGVDKAKEMSMIPIVKSQYHLVDAPLYVAARDRFLDQGMDREKAIELAEQVVRDAQGGGNIIDTAEAMQGGPYRKLFTNFLTYMITTYNLQAENYQRTFKLKEQDLLDFAANTFVLMTLPAMLTAALNDWIAGDDDDEEYMERVYKEQLSFMLSMNPLGAQFSGVATGFDYSGPQGTAIISKVGDLAQQTGQGENDEALWKATIWTIGLATGLPAAQVSRSLSGGIQAYDEGADAPEAIKKFMFGPER
jgi:hypothetical protein